MSHALGVLGRVKGSRETPATPPLTRPAHSQSGLSWGIRGSGSGVGARQHSGSIFASRSGSILASGEAQRRRLRIIRGSGVVYRSRRYEHQGGAAYRPRRYEHQGGRRIGLVDTSTRDGRRIGLVDTAAPSLHAVREVGISHLLDKLAKKPCKTETTENNEHTAEGSLIYIEDLEGYVCCRCLVLS